MIQVCSFSSRVLVHLPIHVLPSRPLWHCSGGTCCKYVRVKPAVQECYRSYGTVMLALECNCDWSPVTATWFIRQQQVRCPQILQSPLHACSSANLTSTNVTHSCWLVSKLLCPSVACFCVSMCYADCYRVRCTNLQALAYHRRAPQEQAKEALHVLLTLQETLG